MNLKGFWDIFIILICGKSALGANILVYIGAVASYSHQSGLVPVVESLVARGHNVTYFSPFEYYGSSREKVHEVSPGVLREDNEMILQLTGALGLRTRLDTPSKTPLLVYLYVFQNFVKNLAESEEMIGWIKRAEFDLVIIDSPANEIAHVAAYYWKARVIAHSAISFIFPWELSLFNIPDEVSWLPQFDMTAVDGGLGFWERCSNSIWAWASMWVYQNLYLPRIASLMRGALVPELPELGGVIKEQTELMLVNFDSWDQFARALPPFVVPVSGLRLNGTREVGALPEDVEAWLADGETSEFVYVSFGTAVRITTAPDSFVLPFLEAFNNVGNMKFLLKWDGEALKNVPKNVLVRAWYPQLDVLGDKRIRGFITQGGQNSVQEAIFYGVPMILMPVYGDQDVAGKYIAERKLGKLMEFSKFTREGFEENIREILENEVYAKNVRRMQGNSRKTQGKVLDNALEWIERVIQRDDLSHLKPPSVSQRWWIYRGFDVFALVFLVVYGITGSTLYLVWSLLKKRFSGKKENGGKIVEKNVESFKDLKLKTG